MLNIKDNILDKYEKIEFTEEEKKKYQDFLDTPPPPIKGGFIPYRSH